MNRSPLLLALLVAAGFAVAPAEPAGAAAAAPEAADDLGKLVPEAADLTSEQRAVLKKVVDQEFCYCGCPHTLAGCLREHKACRHAPRMVALAARRARGGLAPPEIVKLLTDYYASFDAGKRAHLDVKGFGPPLGNAAAPVSIVEFSDFTCPYCQMLRTKLEEFVKDRAGRVKLYYKPFPIASHERSFEAAVAGEWARDQGKFWPMHDLLFEHPHALSTDDLAAYAAQAGADPADLREALQEGRYRAKVEGSMAEARAAGIRGTPTLFFDGRRLGLPDYSDAALGFTLEDEEEWRRNKGAWTRD